MPRNKKISQSIEPPEYHLTKDIGKYIVYGDGRMYSKVWKRFLKAEPHRKGYTRIHLMKDGKDVKIYTHRIIAEAFLPNPLNLPEVDHINEDKTDNRVENLRWVTSKQNSRYYHEKRTGKSPDRTHPINQRGGSFPRPIQNNFTDYAAQTS